MTEESASYPTHLCIVSGGEDRKDVKGAHTGRQRNSYPRDGECCYVGHQGVSQTFLPMPTFVNSKLSTFHLCMLDNLNDNIVAARQLLGVLACSLCLLAHKKAHKQLMLRTMVLLGSARLMPQHLQV